MPGFGIRAAMQRMRIAGKRRLEYKRYRDIVRKRVPEYTKAMAYHDYRIGRRIRTGIEEIKTIKWEQLIPKRAMIRPWKPQTFPYRYTIKTEFWDPKAQEHHTRYWYDYSDIREIKERPMLRGLDKAKFIAESKEWEIISVDLNLVESREL